MEISYPVAVACLALARKVMAGSSDCWVEAIACACMLKTGPSRLRGWTFCTIQEKLPPKDRGRQSRFVHHANHVNKPSAMILIAGHFGASALDCGLSPVQFWSAFDDR
jgi:hypothetical protein